MDDGVLPGVPVPQVTPDSSRQEVNNYAYGMGDPINNVDWTGLMSPAIAAGR